jgi:hypothetical protein
MGSRRSLVLAIIGVILVGYVAMRITSDKPVRSTRSDSIPSPASETAHKAAPDALSASEGSQKRLSGPGKGSRLQPHHSEIAAKVMSNGEVPAADFAFESWLDTYGYNLSVADMISMLTASDQTPARKARLFDFFLTESPEAYDFFHSKDGADFLEALLADKSTDPATAKKIGRLLQWSNGERNSDLSDTYAQRLAASTSAAEKTGLVSAIDDPKLLRSVAFDHRQPSAVREAAIDGILRQNRDATTVKDLLDLTDTQPELERAVVRSAAMGCANGEELSGIVATLRREGSASDANAAAIGKAFAGSYQYNWIRNIDPEGDPFLKKVLESYREEYAVSYSAKSQDTAH